MEEKKTTLTLPVTKLIRKRHPNSKRTLWCSWLVTFFLLLYIQCISFGVSCDSPSPLASSYPHLSTLPLYHLLLYLFPPLLSLSVGQIIPFSRRLARGLFSTLIFPPKSIVFFFIPISIPPLPFSLYISLSFLSGIRLFSLDMIFSPKFGSILVAITAALAVEAVNVQKPGLTQSATSKQRADTIKQAYREAYGDYVKYAYGYDELKPLTKTGSNSFGGWGATIVDSLSTSFIMGHNDLFSQGVEFVKKVDFTKTDSQTISLFETTIRYLGGILAAYEFGGKNDPQLLAQAKVVGDHLLTGWVGNNDIPYNTLNWNRYGTPDTSNGANIAEAGTLLIEFDRLSKFTGDSNYRNHAVRSMNAIIHSKPVFAGLYGQGIDPSTNAPTNDYVTWGGGSDSFFEYLVKYAYLIGDDKGPWLSTWVDAVKSSVKHLVNHPTQTQKSFLTYLSDYSDSSGGVLPRFSHLACFVGGNWILGGKMLENSEINDHGLELAAGCINTYASSPTGIGPESFVYIGAKGNQNGVTIYNQDFYRANGFDFDSAQYILRPEVLESVFYAWRTTGDSQWQELAWNAWNSINKYCKAPASYASIDSVNSTSPHQYNDSESFLYAETFKYLYLIFADPNTINLDEYVLNTEAHPFKIDNPQKTYHANANAGAVIQPDKQSTSPSVVPSGSGSATSLLDSTMPGLGGQKGMDQSIDQVVGKLIKRHHKRRFGHIH